MLAGSPTLTELQRNVSLTDLGLRISGGLEFLVFPEELVNVHAPTPSGPGHPGITIFLETAGRFTPQED